MNKKYTKSHSSFLIFFLAFISIINFLFALYSVNSQMYQKERINSLETKIYELIGNYQDKSSRDNTSELESLYKDVDSKVDSSITRLLTIVGIVAAFLTFVSFVVAFKAPRDLEKKIDDLKILIEKTQSLYTERESQVEEAKYQALISASMAKSSCYIRVGKLTNLIKKYPNRADAYKERGYQYIELRDFSKAIDDFELAREFGLPLDDYYHAMGYTCSEKENQEMAIFYYTKAISLAPEQSSSYCNRGCEYIKLKRNEDALLDFNKSIDIDPDNFEAYFDRSYVYELLWESALEEDKKHFAELAISDLEKAIKINPQDIEAPKRLKQIMQKFNKSETNDDEQMDNHTKEDLIASIDERIGDLSAEDEEYETAFMSYNDAFTNYSTHILDNKNVEYYLNKASAVIGKVERMILSANDENLIEFDLAPVERFRTLVNKICVKGYERYSAGDKKGAEKLFRSVLRSRKSCLNLAYMKRRGETLFTDESVKELLDMHEDKASMIWCINKALSLLAVDSDIQAWDEAVDIVSKATSDFESAVVWWNDTEIVDDKERDIVKFLLMISGKQVADKKKVEEKFAEVQKYGYNIPAEILDRYKE